jgi:hypothetical protein
MRQQATLLLGSSLEGESALKDFRFFLRSRLAGGLQPDPSGIPRLGLEESAGIRRIQRPRPLLRNLAGFYRYLRGNAGTQPLGHQQADGPLHFRPLNESRGDRLSVGGLQFDQLAQYLLLVRSQASHGLPLHLGLQGRRQHGTPTHPRHRVWGLSLGLLVAPQHEEGNRHQPHGNPGQMQAERSKRTLTDRSVNCLMSHEISLTATNLRQTQKPSDRHMPRFVKRMYEVEIPLFTAQLLRSRNDPQNCATQTVNRSLLLDQSDGSCSFLDSGGNCRIQPVKPHQCSDFPNPWNFPGFEKLCRAKPVEVTAEEWEWRINPPPKPFDSLSGPARTEP